MSEANRVSRSNLLKNAVLNELGNLNDASRINLVQLDRLAEITRPSRCQFHYRSLPLDRASSDGIISTPLPPVFDQVDFRLRDE